MAIGLDTLDDERELLLGGPVVALAQLKGCRVIVAVMLFIIPKPGVIFQIKHTESTDRIMLYNCGMTSLGKRSSPGSEFP